MTRVGLDETIQQQHQQHQQPMFDMMLGVQHQSQQQQQQQQQQQFAAAAAQRGNVIVANEEAKASSKAAKRKTYGQTVPQFGAQSASVARRNARERNRVKQVNQGFDVLRQHIPLSLIQALGDSSPAASPGNCSPASSSSGGGGGGGSSRAGNKKPSKVETLRLALVYIESLRAQLQEDDEQSGSGGVDRLEDADDQPSYYQPHQDQQQSPIYAPAPCSEASSSPTPSFESDASPAPTSHGYETNFATGMYALAPADPYANYDASFSPDDLVQYISLAWQQH